ncbi:MAG: hypothetical protein Q8N83_08130 [Ignavibacteria bacterium]|nr:hypothetical protein [Ignavibacteria bacterium]
MIIIFHSDQFYNFYGGMFVGLFDGKIDINVWCENTFYNSDDFLLKFTSVFNARSSILKLQPSILTHQSSFFNLSQFIINAKVNLLSTRLFSSNKLHFITVTKSRFAGNSKFVNFPQTRNAEHFTQNMRFLANFAGEGG